MRKNLGLKVLSLIVAILLSIFVNGRLQNSVISFIVPIEIKNLPEDKIILYPISLQARVTLRGPSYLVSKLATNPTVLKINIPQNQKTNEVEVPLATNVLELPPTVTVDGIDPAKITLKLDDRVEQVVKLKVPTIGEVSKSLELKSITTDPEKIEVSGPQTLLAGLNSLETTPVDLRGVSDTSIQEVVVLVPNKFTKLTKDIAKVKITVIKKNAIREFKNLPIEIRAKNSSYSAKPNQVSVKVTGPLESIDALEEKSLIPFVRIDEDFTENKTVKIEVDTPEDIEVLKIEPQSVLVTRIK